MVGKRKSVFVVSCRIIREFLWVRPNQEKSLRISNFAGRQIFFMQNIISHFPRLVCFFHFRPRSSLSLFCILFRNDSPPPLLNSLVETFSWDLLSQLFSFLRCLRQWNNAIWREIIIKALGEAPHIHTGHQSSKKWNFLFTSFILV